MEDRLKDDLEMNYGIPNIHWPGCTISEWMFEKGKKVSELATAMKIDGQTVKQILRGEKDLTDELAEKLYNATQIPISFWMNSQATYQKQKDTFYRNTTKKELFEMLKQELGDSITSYGVEEQTNIFDLAYSRLELNRIQKKYFK